ncbi:hypothetical protein C0992_010724, partial [Termitomyces sp. T32_za158]
LSAELEDEINERTSDLFIEPDSIEPRFQDSSPIICAPNVPLVNSDEEQQLLGGIDAGNSEEQPILGDIDSGYLDETEVSTARAQAQAILNAYTDSQEVPSLEEEDEPLPEAYIESLRISQDYIRLIQNATLDKDKLDKDTLYHLRNPIEGPVNIQDPDDRLSLEIFTATNASEATYNQCCNAILHRYSDSKLLSFYKVKRLIAAASGVVPIMDDMCINSCHAFTGPFSELDACTICFEPCFDPEQLAKHGKKVPRQQTCTFPLGPQIQTLRRSTDGAEEMCYLEHKIKDVMEQLDNLEDEHGSNMIYDDIFCGSDFVEFADHVQITNKDTMVFISIDSVQLYQSKKSDT